MNFRLFIPKDKRLYEHFYSYQEVIRTLDNCFSKRQEAI